MATPLFALTPVPGAVEVSIKPKFSWRAVAGATYEFQIGEDPTFAILQYAATATTNNHVARETLAFNTTYYWRVRAVTSVGTGDWTSGFFTTRPKPLPSTPSAKTALPVQVFVSHTQKDVEFCDLFDRACARVGIKAFRSEFERIELPAFETIREAIRNSQALFLLVGKELARAQSLHESSWEHTQNWIAYETGIACQREIDVWVICDDVTINFPVPYLNNYLPVSLRNKECFDYFVSILKRYATGLRTTFPSDGSVIQCQYTDCKATYNLNVTVSSDTLVVCPQCLRHMLLRKGWPAVK